MLLASLYGQWVANLFSLSLRVAPIHPSLDENSQQEAMPVSAQRDAREEYDQGYLSPDG